MVTIRGLAWGARNLLVTPRYFKNWYELMLFPSVGILNGYGLKFYFPSLMDLAYDSYVLRENFFEKQYDWLDAKDKIVIDIGANMGDTAILFASKGAKKVIAFEPYKYQFDKAVKNIELNGMGEKIDVRREAVSDKSGEIVIKEGYSDGSQSLQNEQMGLKTKTITLEQLIDQYKPQIMKCDCEGSEYEIIFSTPKAKLATFEQLIIDYHHRGPTSLEDYLKDSGFEVERREYNKDSGMLKAKRIR